MQLNGPIIPQSIQQSLSISGKSQPVSANGIAVSAIAAATCPSRTFSGCLTTPSSDAATIGVLKK